MKEGERKDQNGKASSTFCMHVEGGQSPRPWAAVNGGGVGPPEMEKARRPLPSLFFFPCQVLMKRDQATWLGARGSETLAVGRPEVFQNGEG